MVIHDEINTYSAKEDAPILHWLLVHYPYRRDFIFCADNDFDTSGPLAYTDRTWYPTKEGRALHAQLSQREYHRDTDSAPPDGWYWEHRKGQDPGCMIPVKIKDEHVFYGGSTYPYPWVTTPRFTNVYIGPIPQPEVTDEPRTD